MTLATFYGGSVATWQRVLGDELHYHHGLFADGDDLADALRRAVRVLYPYLPHGARVLDVGCGWGGPLAMLVEERGCAATGVTISSTQRHHAAVRGLDVRCVDVETVAELGRFDVALLLESFEHIVDKAALLARLRGCASRIVLRVNCQDHAPAGVRFGGTMHMVDSRTLRALLEAAGWRIWVWRDRRPASLASQPAWRERLRRLPPDVVAGDEHLATFLGWVEDVMRDQRAWAQANPLLEIVAD
ncbi:methyltransferase domain-containing protein [Solirubrobacter phytolaccae]|uniref:Methyltransferase domain-containing protein n=1 Tax=Solirubrobacter phytolaccae TaxID=1404360 RepID=A0A9X3N2S4_9ACTN|nr:methyltransferase domain-containing protein [Solirubrobacter phytolaccae]MDA0178780.1 methyltransferase domain-containing protein [Solirubrobacter phytolaccae]